MQRLWGMFKKNGAKACVSCVSCGVDASLNGDGLCGSCERTGGPADAAAAAVVVVVVQNGGKGNAVSFEGTIADGTVVCVGSNTYGQCGDQQGKSMLSVVVMTQMKKKVVMVAAGLYHSVFLTEMDEIYGCGRNLEQQLGSVPGGATLAKIKKPFEGSVVAIECGHYHTTLLSEAGEIAECGRGRAMVLLGTGNVRFTAIACGGTWTLAYSGAPLHSTWAWDEQENGTMACGPNVKDIFASGNAVCVLEKTSLVDLKAGKWEALFLTDDSRLLTMRFDPLRAKFLVLPMDGMNASIVSLACGQSMNAAQTIDGCLVTWKRDGSSGDCSAPVEMEVEMVSAAHCGGKQWACVAGSTLMVDGVPAVQGTDFSFVRCGYQHTLAITGTPKGHDFVLDMVALMRRQQNDHSLMMRSHGLDPERVAACVARDFSDGQEKVDIWISYLYTSRLVLTREACNALAPLVNTFGPPRLKVLVERFLGNAVKHFQEDSLYDRLLAHCAPWFDVTLVSTDVDGAASPFPFARCILAARSPYFSALFSDRWAVSNVVQVDSSPSAIKVFLQWCGGISIPILDENNAVDVLQLASLFDCAPLVRAAERWLARRIQENDIDEETLAGLGYIADLLDRKALKEKIALRRRGGGGGGGGGHVARFVPSKVASTIPTPIHWTCRKCTFQNTDNLSQVCSMCDSDRSPSGNFKDCAVCTFKNNSLRNDCEMCGTHL